ncbi:MAG: P-type conjugative transfer protein TrbL [Aeromonadales bacterium]|nr:P-type conjugative transfer protein TrbL [Aeromonadales bacterium]
MIRLLIIFFVIFSNEAMASNQNIAISLNPESVLNNLIYQFLDYVALSAKPIQQAANRLFWYLVPIATAALGIREFFKDGNLKSFMGEFVKLLIVIGIYRYLLENAPAISKSIIDSMTSITTQDNVGPSELLDMTFNVVGVLNNCVNESIFSPVATIFMRITIVFFEIVLFLVILKFACIFISAHVLCFCGIFVLGFGAYGPTRSYATNYLRTIIGISLELMTIIVIINAACMFLKQIEKQVMIYQQQGNSLTMSECSTLIVIALFIYLISRNLPAIVSSLITNSHSTHDSSLKIPFTRGIIGMKK